MAPKDPAKSPAKAAKSPRKTNKNAGVRRPKVKKSTPAPVVGQAVDILKKGFLMGLGATVQTAERLKEMVSPVIDEIADSDTRRTSGDLARVLLSEKTHFEARLKSLVEGFMRASIKSLNLVTREDLDALRREMRTANPGHAPAGRALAGRPPARSATGGGTGKPPARGSARPARGPAKASARTEASGGSPSRAPGKFSGRPKPGGPPGSGGRKPRPGGKPTGGAPPRRPSKP